jgi:hypothetical protein
LGGGETVGIGGYIGESGADFKREGCTVAKVGVVVCAFEVAAEGEGWEEDADEALDWICLFLLDGAIFCPMKLKNVAGDFLHSFVVPKSIQIPSIYLFVIHIMCIFGFRCPK